MTKLRLVRARAGAHPRRRELAGARVRRRSAAIRSSSRAAQGACIVDTDGREYLDYVQSWGASILGHAAPGGRRGGAAGRGRGHVVRRADAARGRARRGDLRARPVGREGAARVVGHRSGDDRGAPRARRDRPREDREVRGLLPRPPRRAARAGRQRRRDARAARFGGRHRRARSPTRSSCPYNDLAALDAALAEHGADVAAVLVEPIAANMGLVAAGAPGSSTALRERCTRTGALLVFDEVITGFRVGARRRAGRAPASRPTSRSSARSSAAGSRSRRSAAAPRSWTSSRRSVPCTKRARSRGTRSRPRPGSRCSRELDDGRVRDARSDRRAARGRAARARSPTRASPRRSRARSRSSACSSPPRRCATTTTRRRADHERYARALPRPARPRRVLRAERLRDAVPEPRAHRRRHRRNDRRRRGSRGGVGLTVGRRAELRLVAVALLAALADVVHVEQRAR